MYFSDACSENCDWLLRAINAAIFLQAVCARDLKAAGYELSCIGAGNTICGSSF